MTSYNEEQQHDAEDSDHRAPGNSLDTEERIGQSALDDQSYPLYDSEAEDSDIDSPAGSNSSSIQSRLSHAAYSTYTTIVSALSYLNPKPQPTLAPINSAPLTPSTPAKRFKAPPGKKIHVPVRVEPKVYFAAERTFLSWLEFSILLGSIAAALLNFGDNVALFAACGFTVTACLALVYSVGLYVIRVRLIRERRAKMSRYYVWWGPTLLCGLLFLAMGVNFLLRFGSAGQDERRAVGNETLGMIGDLR